MGRGVHRGFITFEELSKSLGKRNLSEENLSQAFIHILNDKVSLVEKKSDYKSHRKKDSASKEEGKTIEKSDDPIRMYLREMGGVELLSREGEIAIAKRIEAGKDVMLNALSQSPITAQQFFEWKTKLQNDEILVREIIDIDTNYMEDDSTGQSAKQKKSGNDSKEKLNNVSENTDETEDEFNPTLAAMESEIKPKVLATVLNLTKDYNKLIKYQKEKLIKIIAILIIIILLVNIGFSYKLFRMIEYDDKTYDGILEEIKKIFIEKKSVRLIDNLSLEIREVLGKQPDIQNSYVMASGSFPVYYANSKLVFAVFDEGNENESLESYITRENWSELDYYISNVNSFPSDRNDIFHPIPDYLLFIPLPQLEVPANLKILEDPTNPLIPSNFELIFQSDKTGMVIYKINHSP